MPSQCTKSSVNSGTVSNTPTAPATTAPTVTSASSSGIITNQNLVLNGQVVGNTNQIFLTLETPQPIDFPSEDAMKNFLQVKFENCPPPTVYCSQKPPPNKQLFDCLMLFPSGVPNTSFKAIFSYDYQGKTGFNNLAIDPLTLTSSNPRNRRTNSRSAFNQRMT